MSLPSVREIETATVLAWPALEIVTDGSWIGRFARGYTNRANSVQAFDPADDRDAPARLDAMASHYTARNLPPVFRLTPLAGTGLHAALAERGSKTFDHSLVMAMAMPATPWDVTGHVTLQPPHEPGWYEAQARLSGYSHATTETLGLVLAAVKLPTCGMLIEDDAGTLVAACYTAVAHRVALFHNVIVAEHARGKGFGRAAMTAALNWAQGQGAHAAALQVLASNAPAVALYRSLGFADHYTYHYHRF